MCHYMLTLVFHANPIRVQVGFGGATPHSVSGHTGAGLASEHLTVPTFPRNLERFDNTSRVSFRARLRKIKKI